MREAYVGDRGFAQMVTLLLWCLLYSRLSSFSWDEGSMYRWRGFGSADLYCSLGVCIMGKCSLKAMHVRASVEMRLSGKGRTVVITGVLSK